MRLSRVAVFALGMMLMSSLSSAQDATGRIVGTVYDQQEAVIPGVQVTVTNTATQIARKATTDRDGYFQVLELPIGNYTVTAEHEGFRTMVSNEQKLLINQSLRIDLKMQVGGSSEKIEVQANGAPVETVDSTLGQSVTSRPLVNMPLNGRDVLDLALLQPGVTETDDGNGGAGNFSIAGGRSDSVTYLLDGGLNNDLVDNSAIYNPNPDSIAEFRLLTSNYTAEYGRNGGGIISVVTKSGSNQFHGSAFEFLRNDAFNANDFFNIAQGLPRDVLKRNQFGGTLGGPITIPHLINGKDRFFFFVAYQGQKLVQDQALIESTVFTPLEINGDFSQSSTDQDGNVIPDPGVRCFLSGMPTMNLEEPYLCQDGDGNALPAHTFFQPDPLLARDGKIDPTRFNSVALAYLNAGLIPQSPSGVFSGQSKSTDNHNELTGRLDFNLSSKDKISVTLGMLRNPFLSPFAFASVSGFPNTTNADYYFHNLGYTRIFSPTVLNEFHFVTHRSNYVQDLPARTLPTPSQLGIGVTPDEPTGPTNLYFGDNNLTIGFSENGPTTYIENTFAWTDTLSWTRGKHNWKLGGGFSAYQENLKYDYYINGEFDFNFSGIGSNNSLADFLMGIPELYFQAAAAPSTIRSKSTYLFAQDEWHVRKNLVLTLGLRYEYSTPKADTQGRTYSILPGEQSKLFVNAPVGLVFPGDAGVPKGSNFPDKNDFAPRFGFAWDIGGNGKTSLRGGIGLFYDILKGEDNLQFNGQPPFVGSATLFFDDVTETPITSELNYMSDPFGATGVPNSFPSKPPASDVDFTPFLPFGSSGFVYTVNPHLRTPYIYQYNLSLQHELLRDTVLEANYVGSSSHKLTSLVDANPMILGTTDRILNLSPGNSTCTLDDGTCSFAAIPEFRNLSYGNYNSLEASLTRQVKNSSLGTAYFTFSYTYAHNIDNVSGFRQRNSSVPAYDPSFYYASGDSDIRQRISFSGGWDLPFDRAWGTGPKKLTRGWSLYPIVTWRTGFPFDVGARLSNRFEPAYVGSSGAGDPFLSSTDLVAPVRYMDPSKTVDLDWGGFPETGNYWFDPNSFSSERLENLDPVNNPSERSYGTLPRNILRGPHQTNFDLAVAKTTPLAERVNLEFRVEFFNILNHPEFGMPDTNLGHDTFGQIISTGSYRGSTARVIQLAARLTF